MTVIRTLVLGCVLLAGAGGPAVATGFSTSCTLQAPGDACVLGFAAARSGLVSACTRAGQPDERWRTSLARKLAPGDQSAVGDGSTTRCSGRTWLPVAPGKRYVAVVTLERPGAGAFPRKVAIVLSGPLASPPTLRGNGQGTLVVNGDFEQGPDPAPTYRRLPAGDISVPGWAVTGGSVDHVASPYWQSVSGLRNVDLSGWTAGSLTQAINGLVADQEYLLTFRLAGNPDCGNPVKRMTVVIDDVAHPFTFDATGGTHADLMWRTADLRFVYQGRNPNLQLASQEPSICGPIVDDVRLVASP